jgi:hypothetical protein
MPYEQSVVTLAQNSETLVLKPFAMTWVLNTNFQVRIRLPEWRCGKEEHDPV